MLDKINEIVEKNVKSEDDFFDGVFMARIVLAAYGTQVSVNDLKWPTLGLYKNGILVAKVKMPNPEIRHWFVINYLYESPRVANTVGFTVNFETGTLEGNLKELGLNKGPTWKLAYNYKAQFDSIKVLKGKEKLENWGAKVVIC